MLILTRKKGESIVVNGNIEIRVVELEDGRVKLGIEAPRDVEIIRKELYERVEEENIADVGRRIDLGQMKDLLKKDK